MRIHRKRRGVEPVGGINQKDRIFVFTTKNWIHFITNNP